MKSNRFKRIIALILCASVLLEGSAVAFADETGVSQNSDAYITENGEQSELSDALDGENYQVTDDGTIIVFSSEESEGEEASASPTEEPTAEPTAEPTEEPEETAESFSEVFKDENFRKLLREYVGTKEIFENLSDDDGLTKEILTKIAEVTELDFSDDSITLDLSEIKSLDGIEKFESLSKLGLADIKLEENQDEKSFDIDKLKKLTELKAEISAFTKDNLYIFSLPSWMPTLTGTEYSEEYSAYTAEINDSAKLNYSYSSESIENTVSVELEVTKTEKLDTADISNATVEIGDVYYTGESVVPEIKVSLEDKTLVEGTDYTVTLSDNILAGQATAVISGIGDYSGEKSVNFTVKLQKPTVTGFSLEDGVAEITFGGNAPEGSRYVLRYSKNSDMSDYIEISSDSNTVKTDKLDSSSSYYYTAQVVSGEEKSEFSDVAELTTISLITSAETQYNDTEYTGKAIEPEITVKDEEDEVLEEGEDYTVEFENNTSIGTARAVVEGVGNYSGEAVASFTISPSVPEVVSIDNSVAGKLTFKLSSENPSGTKYIIEYSKKSNMSDAKTVTSTSTTITIDAVSLADCYYRVYAQYTGSDKINYASDKTAVNSVFVKGSLTGVVLKNGEKYSYTGSQIKPAVTVYGGAMLKEGTDYRVSYSTNKSCGKGYVTVYGMGNYVGSMKATFAIVPATPKITKVENTEGGGQLDVYFTQSSGSATRFYYSTDKNFGSYKTLDSSDGHAVIKNLSEGKTYYIKARSYINFNGNKCFSSYCTVTNKKTKKSITSASVSCSSKLAYTGSNLKPTPTVKLSGKTLKSGTDYTVSYSNNKNVGIADMTIVGSGDYAGKKSFKFYIVPKAPTIKSISVSNSSITVKLSQATGADGAYVIYSTSSSFSSYTKKRVYGSSITLSGLTAGKTYYIKASSFKAMSDGHTKVGSSTSVYKAQIISDYNKASVKISVPMHKSGYLSSGVSKTLSAGSSVQILDNSQYLVKVNYNGTVGYVSKYALNMPSKFTAYSTTRISLWSNSARTNKIGEIYKNTEFYVMGNASGAYQIFMKDGRTGYVNPKYVDIKVRDGSNYDGDATPTATIATNVSDLNVRTGAGTNYDRVTMISKSGTKVTKLETVNSWTMIMLSDGTVGYCLSEYLGSSSNNSGNTNTTNTSGKSGFGIDISEWNGDVDIYSIRKEINFVIIRCGYGGNYTDQDDARFVENVKKCENLGIPYGIYLYSYATSKSMAQSEAAHVKRLVKYCGSNFRLGIWYDIEEQSQYNLGNTMNTILNEFIGNLSGYKVGLYTNPTFLRGCFYNISSSVPLWVACWGSEKPTGTIYNNMVIWQYGDESSFSGLPGKVFDANYCYPGLGL